MSKYSWNERLIRDLCDDCFEEQKENVDDKKASQNLKELLINKSSIYDQEFKEKYMDNEWCIRKNFYEKNVVEGKEVIETFTKDEDILD